MPTDEESQTDLVANSEEFHSRFRRPCNHVPETVICGPVNTYNVTDKIPTCMYALRKLFFRSVLCSLSE